MLDETTLAILRDFAHGLVKPGRETRMIVLKNAVPALGLTPGDGVVYTASSAANGRWLVLRTRGEDGKPRFTVDRAPACPPACACLCVYARRQAGRRVHAGGLAHRVCGRVLFTIHIGETYVS